MRNSFTKNLIWFWENAEKLLVVLFLATFSLNIRKVFLTKHSFLNGEFNEYTTPSFSLADLLMLTTILIFATKWLFRQFIRRPEKNITIENNNHNASRISSMPGILYIINKIKLTLRQLYSIITCNRDPIQTSFIFLLLFLLWTGLSVFWSDFRLVAFYRFAVLAELFLFLAIAAQILKNTKWLNIALFALVASGLFQSSLGIAQFLSNQSLGLHWLGESMVGPDINGVAKIIVSGVKHIRAYGTFPHPNILAGFLIVPIFILLGLLTERIRHGTRQSNVSRETFLNTVPAPAVIILLLVLLLGLVLTFSRSALLGLALGGFIFLWQNLKHLFDRRKSLWIALVILFLFFSAYIVSHSKLNFLLSEQSLNERILYSRVSRETIAAHPWIGIGIGQFVFEEHQTYPDLSGWQYQPVHNIFLLVASELGIIGFFLLFISFLTYMPFYCIKRITLLLRRNTELLRLTSYSFCFLIFSFLFISLFDHYFWDIKQGMIIFALPFLFLAASYQINSSSSHPG